MRHEKQFQKSINSIKTFYERTNRIKKKYLVTKKIFARI
jgi:hypothetical protein